MKIVKVQDLEAQWKQSVSKQKKGVKKMDGTKREKTLKVLFSIMRIVTIVLAVILFIPSLNPAKISEKVPKEASLLTSGIFYNTLTSKMGLFLRRGWVSQGTMLVAYFSCMACIAGIVLAIFGVCFTLGNNKARHIGTKLSLFGGLISIIAMIGSLSAYNMITSTEKASKVKPIFPAGAIYIIVLSAILLVTSVLALATMPKAEKDEKFGMETKYQLFLYLLPFLVLAFIFCYLPLWGWRYAFFDYRAGDTLSIKNFVGFKWFAYLFKNKATAKYVGMVLRNTLAMSGLGIATSFLPLFFAVFLNEVKKLRFKRVVQTLTTIPNFISWILVYAVAFAIFSTDGFISSIMINSGQWSQGVNMLMGSDHIWLKMLGWGLWKSLGWNAIIYIAAISGVDQSLYEAAKVDGAGRFQRMWHVTIPAILPTYCVLLLMQIANILTNGMEQYLAFRNATNTDWITVLDLYVYDLGIVGGSIPLSTVISMVKSVVSVILLFTANRISKAIRGENII